MSLDFNEFDTLEAKSEEIEDKYEDLEPKGIVFGIIGVGQGGCRLADTFYQIGYRKIILFNTTEKDMQGLLTPRKHWVVPSESDGAGKDVEVGERVAKACIPDLIKKMNTVFKNVSNILICVGAGGGSGTGSASIFANACKQWVYDCNGDYSGTKVGFLVALPARSESSKVLSNTSYLLSKIVDDKYSPIIFVDNQRIAQAVKSNALNKWQQSNKLVCSLFDVFNSMCARETELDTFDPKDYADVLSHGVTTMAIAGIPESALKTNESELVRDTILSDKVKTTLKQSMLLQDVDISTATHASFIVTCRKEALEQMDGNTIPKLSETIINMMGGDLGKSVTVHKGVYLLNEEKIRIFMLFSGMQFPSKKIEEYKMA
jgi:cell division GTPase FtsZ